jgi:Tol biopolymer transport system component
MHPVTLQKLEAFARTVDWAVPHPLHRRNGDLVQTEPTPSLLIASTWEDFAAAWSPDGQRIAFTSTRSGESRIWVCDRDGSNATQLSDEVGGYPQWSPDGRYIVFETFGPNHSLRVIRSDGGTLRSPAVQAGKRGLLFPNWSRDGKWIYFRSWLSGVRRSGRCLPKAGTPSKSRGTQETSRRTHQTGRCSIT